MAFVSLLEGHGTSLAERPQGRLCVPVTAIIPGPMLVAVPPAATQLPHTRQDFGQITGSDPVPASPECLVSRETSQRTRNSLQRGRPKLTSVSTMRVLPAAPSGLCEPSRVWTCEPRCL